MIKTRKGNDTLSIVEFKEKVANIYQEAMKNHPIKDNRGISLNALLDYYNRTVTTDGYCILDVEPFKYDWEARQVSKFGWDPDYCVHVTLGYDCGTVELCCQDMPYHLVNLFGMKSYEEIFIERKGLGGTA